MGGKWLQLLKEAAPPRVVFNSDMVSETYFASIDAAAEALAVKVIQAPYRNAAALERVIAAFAAEPNGDLVMVPPTPYRQHSRIDQSACGKVSAAHDLYGEGLRSAA
jgi:hypothetical protein